MNANLPVKVAEPPPVPQDLRNPFQPGEIEGGKSRRHIPTQTIIMGLCLVCSAAALYGMRRYGMQSGMSFAEVNVDYQGLDAEKARTYQRIMADLARAQAPLDIALGDFGKSPFMLDLGDTKVSPELGVAVPSAISEEERLAAEAAAKAQQRAIELGQLASALQLHSVMGGRTPLARINDQTVAVGTIIDETFTVTAIDGRTVHLAADGHEFTLTMETGKHDEGKRSPAKIGSGKAPK